MNTILSSPLSPGSLPPPVAAAVPLSKPFTVKAFKDWGLTTLKCTKQKVMERLGHGTKTIDSELELQIEVLRDTHAKYQVHVVMVIEHLYSTAERAKEIRGTVGNNMIVVKCHLELDLHQLIKLL